MVDRIKIFDPDCEIILQIMNMAIGKSATYRPNLEAYYDMVREIAQKEDLLLIDHYPNWENILTNGEDYFLKFVPDGLHPNKIASVEMIAPYIFERLKEGR
jgi:acyl-CoA thioesterase-1